MPEQLPVLPDGSSFFTADVMSKDIRAGLPSASKLERIQNCPGSHLLEIAKGKPESNEMAEQGTRVHAARETGNTLELNEEEFELYQSGLRYEQRLMDKWKSTFGFQDEEVKEGPRELRLWLHDHKMNPVGSGQLDTHFICRNYAHIIDWKVGFLNHLVGATGNHQLRMQAVLLWLEHPHLEHIRVACAKPRFENSDLDYCDYEVQDLKYSLDAILLALWWSTQPDAQRSPGAHCRYCTAKTACPQALAFGLLPAAIASGVMRGQKPEVAALEVGDDDLYRMWEAGSTIKAVIDACVDRLKEKSDEDLAKMGLRKGKGREMLRWNVQAAFEFLRDKKLWPEAEIFETMEFGITKLGKLATKYLGVGEKYANKEIKEITKEFYTVEEGEKILRNLK